MGWGEWLELLNRVVCPELMLMEGGRRRNSRVSHTDKELDNLGSDYGRAAGGVGADGEKGGAGPGKVKPPPHKEGVTPARRSLVDRLIPETAKKEPVPLLGEGRVGAKEGREGGGKEGKDATERVVVVGKEGADTSPRMGKWIVPKPGHEGAVGKEVAS